MNRLALPDKGALYGDRFRVIVSTDIGGSDPDDFQSMVHYLLYSDMFDTEGIISSAWGAGRASDILTVIDKYEQDYPNLKTYSDHYPTPDYLRSVTRQGEIDFAPYKGYRTSTPGSQLIVDCARKDDDRPLYILGWGLLEDIAQALHDAPDIVDKLRVHYIGGPNKKWGLNAYEYIVKNFPQLWIIEDNSSYRGWFNGGNMEKDLGNHSFVVEHAMKHGALGEFFGSLLDGVIKMGDTPTVAWLLRGIPEIPEQSSWGGRYEHTYNRPHRTYNRVTTLDDEVEIFEVIEFVFDGPQIDVDMDTPVFYLVVDEQEFEGFYCGDGKYKVRFMPKSCKEWSYVTKSDIEKLNGIKGQFVSVPEKAETRLDNGQHLTNWWTDILDPEYSEGPHKGAKTVNMWREEFLRSFEDRFNRCIKPCDDNSQK